MAHQEVAQEFSSGFSGKKDWTHHFPWNLGALHFSAHVSDIRVSSVSIKNHDLKENLALVHDCKARKGAV